jgi:hypothetical protein
MTSEVRVNTIKARSGLGTVSLNDSGVVVSGIVTATKFVGDGSELLNLPINGNTIVLGTAVGAATTVVSFTGIPSWVDRITINIDNLKSNGTSRFFVRVGNSGGFITSGYSGAVTRFGSSGSQAATATAYALINEATRATASWYGTVTITRLDSTNWMISSLMSDTDVLTANCMSTFSVGVSALDRVQISTVSADTFTAGTVNIMYEG